MAEVPPPGGGELQVSPQVLRSSAQQAHQAGAAVSGLAAQVQPACAQAAAAHSGWQFGAELAALISPWQRELTRQASAVTAGGDKLAGSADTYASTERTNVTLAQSANPQ